MIGLSKALQGNGISSAKWSLNASVSDLANATAKGDAVIAQVMIDNGNTIHFVVVDGVTTRYGQKVVAVRDPGTGSQYFVPTDEFSGKFTGQVVFTNK